jgi:Spy/CpxP family protein refolding chaperone
MSGVVMKFKLSALIAGIAAIAITAAPTVVQAEPNNSRMNGAELNLTTEQKAQLQQIGQETRSQMESVLTPQQREQLKANASQAPRTGNRQAATAQLNLSDEQISKIQQIRKSSEERMQAVLTPEQLQKIRQFRRK